MRALAQVADKRIAGFPDVPTVKEAGYDVKLPPQARGIVGPPNMSPEAVAYYADLLRKVTQSGSWKKYLAESQVEDAYMPPDQLKAFLSEYTDQMRGIIKSAGITVVR